MTLAEYEELLADLVARDRITIEQAQELRQRFINGEFDDEDLPLPIVQAQRKDDRGMFYFGQWIVPGRMDDNSRKKFRDKLMSKFDLSMAEISETLYGNPDGKFSRWHESAKMYISSAMLANWLYGNGTNTAPNIDDLVTEQLNYLYRFAGEEHALRALGTTRSEEYIVNRLLLYGGAVWAAWFRGNEAYGYDYGYISQYIPKDTIRTCQPCSSARGYYKLGEGPMPGQICLGGIRCQCERIVIYAPEILARL